MIYLLIVVAIAAFLAGGYVGRRHGEANTRIVAKDLEIVRIDTVVAIPGNVTGKDHMAMLRHGFAGILPELYPFVEVRRRPFLDMAQRSVFRMELYVGKRLHVEGADPKKNGSPVALLVGGKKQ